MAGSEKIKVVARFRPPSADEAASQQSAPAVRFADGRTVLLAEDGGASQSHTFTFDVVLQTQATQAETYEHVSGIVDNVLQGYNGTVLAYGQTGTGKTFSVMGTASEPGVQPRAMQHIFERLCGDESGAEYCISCAYLEIYQETLRDLLEPAAAPASGVPGGASTGGLAIGGTAEKGIYVKNLSQKVVTSEEDALRWLQFGDGKRAVGETKMNSLSSRSHAVFTLTVYKKSADGSERVSKLNIVDLAGSESVSKSGATGNTLVEGSKNNLSLSTLRRVIDALATEKSHVPYRESKLTHLLLPSLGGTRLAETFPREPTLADLSRH